MGREKGGINQGNMMQIGRRANRANQQRKSRLARLAVDEIVSAFITFSIILTCSEQNTSTRYVVVIIIRAAVEMMRGIRGKRL